MQIVDAIKNLAIAMKGSGYIADNWETISAGIGDGDYELPAATTSALGGVKKSTAVASVSVADATAAGAAYDQATAQSTVALANANKAAINQIIAGMKAAGIMA